MTKLDSEVVQKVASEVARQVLVDEIAEEIANEENRRIQRKRDAFPEAIVLKETYIHPKNPQCVGCPHPEGRYVHPLTPVCKIPPFKHPAEQLCVHDHSNDRINPVYCSLRTTSSSIDHGRTTGLSDDDHTQYALADKSRPTTWVAETDVPVLTDAKYPNALLLSGERAMTGNFDLADNALLTANLEINEYNSTVLQLVARGTSTLKKFRVQDIQCNQFAGITTNTNFNAKGATDSKIRFGAYNGVTWEYPMIIYSATVAAATYAEIAQAGDITMLAAKTVDCATNGGYFLPRRLSQAAEPMPQSGELLVWRDTDDDKTYLVFNDPDVGARKVEMT